MLKSAALASVSLFLIAMPVLAEDAAAPGLPGSDPLPAGVNGVFHGNYCGLGDKGPGLPPTDALDEACMHHDACTPSGGVPSCACNARFRSETHAVAVGADQPDDLKAIAGMVEAAIPVIPCH